MKLKIKTHRFTDSKGSLHEQQNNAESRNIPQKIPCGIALVLLFCFQETVVSPSRSEQGQTCRVQRLSGLQSQHGQSRHPIQSHTQSTTSHTPRLHKLVDLLSVLLTKS